MYAKIRLIIYPLNPFIRPTAPEPPSPLPRAPLALVSPTSQRELFQARSVPYDEAATSGVLCLRMRVQGQCASQSVSQSVSQ